MFIAGAYQVTYNGLSMGRTEDGFTLNFAQQADLITGDNLGAVIQDGVFRGVDQVSIDLTLLEYDSALACNVFWDLSNVLGQINTPNTNTVGCLLSTQCCAAFVATKINGPNASPTTLSAGQVTLMPGFQVRQQYANRLRRVPLSLLMLPSSNGQEDATNAFFVTS